MDPLAPLEREHDLILQTIDALWPMLQVLRPDHRMTPELFVRLEAFIQRFADGAHHAKEEQVLFQAMHEAGLPLDAGPLGAMLHEHEQGRALCHAMGTAARACQAGDWSQQRVLAESAAGYCRLLATHIEKEQNVLYPMARQLLGPDVLGELGSRFARVDPHQAAAFEQAAHEVISAAEVASRRASA